MNKRLLSTFLSAGLALALLSGCAGGEETPEDTNDEMLEEETEDTGEMEEENGGMEEPETTE
ncbi:hypothetical protein [Bacillus solimangrovi]|uniref:Uncharacterized protein n=1 Tax=Bacillus solimangrovi TaxID=1305675 RepID=A0A1E5LGZ7_9BACI|nr:hypothetical protein [Bacillus solimangrovi]OEH93344.1 hypothetical protein BFG57_12535 [Bacillus solimangrovi]